MKQTTPKNQAIDRSRRVARSYKIIKPGDCGHRGRYAIRTMRNLTVFLISLLTSLSILGCGANSDRPTSIPKPTYLGPLHEFVINDWEPYCLDPLTGGLTEIDSQNLFVVAEGMAIAFGDASSFKFKIDGKEYSGKLPAINGIAWRPLLVSEKPTGRVQNTPFIVVLKKTKEDA
ncbi:MAG: hypothetical protein R3C53_15620 [Pirellulaceae bacterium]